MAAIEVFTPDNLAGQLDYFIDHQDEWLVSRGVRVDDNTYAMQLEDYTMVTVRFEVEPQTKNQFVTCPLCKEPIIVLRLHLDGGCPAVKNRG